jgi:calcineurin-like phosphoesterase family protein
MNHTPLQLEMIAEHEALLAANRSFRLQLPSIKGYMLACEYELILYMNAQGVWQGALPPPPPNFQTGDGAIEFGLFLYWFNNPTLLNNAEVGLAALALDWTFSLPDSQMTEVNYTYLCTNTLIYVDGSVLSTEAWATFDQGWFAAFANLLETGLRATWYNNGVFPMPSPPKPVALSGAIANTVNIAIVGDWGNGAAPASSVMQQIVGLNPKPDYIVHLGDVYYGGTPAQGDPNSGHYFSLNEESTNLVSAWPAAFAGKSFTLNSNHEMYGGANGLFYDALLPASSPFSAQGGLSCFILQYGGWTILGLDSAYCGNSLDAFMTGYLGSAQIAWIQSLKLDPAKTIVLTHHTGFAYDCSSVFDLWSQVNTALGGNDPYAWYWGHAHNGIVYHNPVIIPVPGQPDFKTNTYARCAGHGALPYGVAPTLENNSNVCWQASSPIPSSTQVYNGFVLLTFQSANNQVTGISESYFDPSSAQPKWNFNLLGS